MLSRTVPKGLHLLYLVHDTRYTGSVDLLHLTALPKFMPPFEEREFGSAVFRKISERA